MKTFRRIILWILLLGALLLTAAFVFVSVHGKALARSYFERATGRAIEVRNVTYLFPLGMDLKNVNIPDAFTADSVRVQVSLPFVRERKIKIRSVVAQNPVITIVCQERPEVLPAGDSPVEENQKSEKKKGAALNGVFIERIILQDGELSYDDRCPEIERQVRVRNLSLTAQNLLFPWGSGRRIGFDGAAEFEAKGLPVPCGRVEGRGWIDIAGRDMDADFNILDVEGGGSLTVKARSENNDLTVKGQVMFDGQPGLEGEKTPGGQESFQETVRELVQAVGLKVVANYEFKTKMDDIHVDKISLSGEIELPDDLTQQVLDAGDSLSADDFGIFSSRQPIKQLLDE